jgi:hypothetical protein
MPGVVPRIRWLCQRRVSGVQTWGLQVKTVESISNLLNKAGRVRAAGINRRSALLATTGALAAGALACQ